MKTLAIKAVVLTDGTDYLIHGSSDETSDQMFKAMMPLWGFDPAKETAHWVELTVTIPDFEKVDV
jgi:hypothetical protein